MPSLNADIEQIQGAIQDWIISNPIIMGQGWLSALNVSNELKVSQAENILFAPTVECVAGSVTPSNATKSTDTTTEASSNAAHSNEGLTSSVTVSLLVVAVFSVSSLTVVVSCFIFKYFCNKGTQRSSHL